MTFSWCLHLQKLTCNPSNRRFLLGSNHFQLQKMPGPIHSSQLGQLCFWGYDLEHQMNHVAVDILTSLGRISPRRRCNRRGGRVVPKELIHLWGFNTSRTVRLGVWVVSGCRLFFRMFFCLGVILFPRCKLTWSNYHNWAKKHKHGGNKNWQPLHKHKCSRPSTIEVL